MEDQFYCLGVQALGLCQYNPLKPNAVYFSIGEAISSIALLLAFTQLVTPGLKFRLRVRATRTWIAGTFFILAFLCVLVAALIPSILSCVVPIVGFPIFWEAVAALLIFSGVIVLSSIYLIKTKFNRRNFKGYFYACSYSITRGDEMGLRALADEIWYSVDNIVKAAAGPRETNTGGKPRAATNVADYGLGLLDLFSDERFCRTIVDAAPFTGVKFIEALGKSGQDRRLGFAFVQQLVRQSLLSDSSMLHKEEDYYGLGHFKWFTKAVFGNYSFVSGAYRPLQAWRNWEDQYNTSKVTEKYIRALKIAFEAYFESKSFQDRPDALLSATTTFVETVRSTISQIRGVSPENIYSLDSYRADINIGSTLEDLVQMVVGHENELPDYPFDAATYDRFKDMSIYGVLAFAIYKFLENLSIDQGHDEEMRTLAIGLWMAIDPHPEGEPSRATQEMQKRLFVHLKKKITDNLEKGYYPMITKVLISLIGVWDSSSKDPNSLGFVTAELHKQLREKFAKVYSADEEKAKHMFPSCVSFDIATNELVDVNKFTKKESRLKINPAG